MTEDKKPKYFIEVLDEETNEIVGYPLYEAGVGSVELNSTEPISFTIDAGPEAYRKPNTWKHELVSIEDVARGIK